MKNIKRFFYTLIITVCVCLVPSCKNPFEPPARSTSETGIFSLKTGELYNGRTILPTTIQSTFAVYTLIFSSDGKDDVSVDRTNANLTDPVTLHTGTWSLAVTAFMDSEKTNPAARGSLDGIVITAGATTSRSLELKPFIEAGATGTFSWNIDYPSEVTAISMTIIPLDTLTGTLEQTLYFKGGTPIVSGNNFASPLSLNTGYYCVQFNLSNGIHDAGRVEYLHIYKNMASQFTYTFTQDHFTIYSVTIGEDSGPGSLRYAIANAASDSTILIEDNIETIELLSRLEINKNLTITANGVIITRDSAWTQENNTSQLLGITGASAEVSINRIHFKDGRAASYGAAIHNQGNLLLESCIFSGNTTSSLSASGGAIYNQTGTLNVKACTFYGNSTAYRGGVFYLHSGALILTGNLFYDNSSAASGGPVVYQADGTATSFGYNVVNMALGTGTTECGWSPATGDKEIESLPLSIETFKPLAGGVAVNVIAALPAGYPTIDFYGAQIIDGAAAGAVQSTAFDTRPGLSGLVVITGTFQTGQNLFADITGLNGSGTISYYWMRGTTLIGSNSNTYTVQSADAGSAITVTVVRSDNSGSVTSMPTQVIVFPPLTGTVSISGTAKLGYSLTADTGALGGSGEISYQWKRDGATAVGANSSTYTLQDTDLGSTITVTVTRSENTGSTSASVTVSEEIELTIGMWDSNGNGWNDNAALKFNVNGTDHTPLIRISGGGGPVYETVTVNLGDEVKIYWVSGGQYDYECAFVVYNSYVPPNPEFNPDPNMWSPANDPYGRVLLYKQYSTSGSVGNGTLLDTFTVSFSPVLTGSISISGTAQQGETLTANTNALSGTGTISYQWKRETANFSTDIGADSKTYVLQSIDAGSKITVTVTRSGNSGSVTSAPTAIVTPNLRLPYYYPGTGITYNGYAGTTGTRTTSGGVTITYPSASTFSADGFFTLEGTVNNPSVYNYALVRVTKTSNSSLTTNYFVRGNFKQRIWLRFGPGTYTVTVSGLTSITLSASLGAEGAIYGWSWSGGISSTVTNTRDEGSSVDGSTPDRRFIYPSYVCQSDDVMVTNLAAELTNGLTDNTAKIKAIHDYIIKNSIYDLDSTISGYRKKQDALTVLGTRYQIDPQYPNGHFLAVCEGYANTFTALARAAGLEVKYVSSISMNHGWNHVYVDGAWKFIDVTWGDTVPDGGPNYVRYTYYLLASLNGYNNSHTGWDVDNTRIMLGGRTAPWQRGVPDGWY